ncbi:MAG: transglycosylase domain-containing protein [Bacteroidetes bacterium]|nr:transglycosylase domain-containing protein [Bacteroidota bacterium]
MNFKFYFRFLKRIAIASTIVAMLFLILNSVYPLRKAPEYCQIITDKDQNILHAFLSNDDKWRMQIVPGEINETFLKTLLYKEDNYFYYHPGVNPIALVRAAFNNIKAGKKTSGASTITMQVARLLYPARRTFLNKAIEMFRAFQLEWKLSKDEILFLYLNLIPYGGNIEGVKAASYFYFNTQPTHLNLSQSVILSIIPNRPNSLHPKKGTVLITKERDKWLNRMMKDKIANEKLIREALSEAIEMNRRKAPKEIPHLSIRLRNKYPGISTITSTIDKKLQEKTEVISYNHYTYMLWLLIKEF